MEITKPYSREKLKYVKGKAIVKIGNPKGKPIVNTCQIGCNAHIIQIDISRNRGEISHARSKWLSTIGDIDTNDQE